MDEEHISSEWINKKLGNQERRERLAQPPKERKGYNQSYSRYVRWMRLLFPLAAMAIVAVLFTWSDGSEEELVVPIQQQATAQKAIGKNELLNPRFESKDEKDQPYTVTASRALQGESDDKLIILEKPVADMLLDTGNWVAVEADKGAYHQETQKLLLQGDVKLFHDEGYQMKTPQLHVDMKKSYAWSDMDVYGQGPAGTLEAKGLKANNETGRLVFTGPAKLVLNGAIRSLN